MSLKKLPILPDESGGDCVREAYVKERNLIQTEDELRSFVKRWKAIWTLHRGDVKKTEAEESLISESYDASAALECVLSCRQNSLCKHVNTDKTCVGVHVVIPVPLMLAEFGANQYGAPTDIILIQMNGGLGEFYNAGD